MLSTFSYAIGYSFIYVFLWMSVQAFAHFKIIGFDFSLIYELFYKYSYYTYFPLVSSLPFHFINDNFWWVVLNFDKIQSIFFFYG